MTSKMLEEALSSFEAVQAQLQQLDPQMIEIAGRLRRQPPQVAMTVARGSSDHAASYFAYLTMQLVGVPVASLPMSVVTLQQAPLKVSGQAVFGFSQSGQSPDLVNSLRLLRKRGALSISLVNAEDSPLEAACEFHVPLCAGPELSVAATKSFISTLSASALLIGHWNQEPDLLQACQALPDGLREAAKQDWSAAIDALRGCQQLMVIGRGAGFAIAQEAALKFKETSGLHAEAFSAAEVKHGPMALVGPDFPLLVFRQADETAESVDELVREVVARGGQVLIAGEPVADTQAAAFSAHRDAMLSRSDPFGVFFFRTQSFQTLQDPLAPVVKPSIVRYDAFKDFAPIATVASSPFVLVGTPKLAAPTTADVIALARQSPGKLNYGTDGVGTSMHLTAEIIKLGAGVDIVHVPYKNGPQVLTELSSGLIELAVMPVTLAQPFIKDGKIKAYGVTSRQRWPSMPEVPALAETPALKSVDVDSWYGLFAPAGTDAAIVTRVAAALREALKDAALVEKMNTAGLKPLSIERDEFAALLKRERETLAAAVKAAGIQPE